MKKGQIVEGIVTKIDFPNKGQMLCEEDEKVMVKNVLPGQKIRCSIKKKRKGKCEGRLLEVLEKSELEMEQPACEHYGACGGCLYQSLPYETQLEIKEKQVLDLLRTVVQKPGVEESEWFEGVKESPRHQEYRNKMEFSFGDEIKGGELSLGMHKRGSFHDIVSVPNCQITDQDFRTILTATLSFFREHQTDFFHKVNHVGFLRHLLVRKGIKTGEILIDLVTTTQHPQAYAQFENGTDEAAQQADHTAEIAALVDAYKECLLKLTLEGKIAGILHTSNDSVADAVINQKTDLLYGQEFFYEELLGLKFKITPFSFFQTNSLGAEVLYETAREFIGAFSEGEGNVIYDLYSGTGTIAQMLAAVAKKVIGVEIVEEAVEAAKENASLNQIDNCEFIAGDVLKVLDDIEEKPDFIVLDPPRDGIHPKALDKIISYGVQRMIYISCKPTSLQRDLVVLQERGYEVQRVCCVDMFPSTANIETVCILARR